MVGSSSHKASSPRNQVLPDRSHPSSVRVWSLPARPTHPLRESRAHGGGAPGLPRPPARLTRFSCIFSKAAWAGVRLSRPRRFSSSFFLLVPMASRSFALSLSFFFFFLKGETGGGGREYGVRSDRRARGRREGKWLRAEDGVPQALGTHRLATPSSATPFSFKGPFWTCS